MARQVTTRTYEYDSAGRITKETVVVEDHAPVPVIYPTVKPPLYPSFPGQPNWRYPHVTYSVSGTVGGKPDDGLAGVPARV